MSVPLGVLIVEDSEDDALLLLRELRRGGYRPRYRRVDTAADMEGALDEDGWDLVISDHSMPRFSSSAALGVLREKGLDLPFILMSGRIGEEAAAAAMKAGVHDYVMKDNPARLNPAVERELREAEVRREKRRAEEKYRSIFENAVEGIFQSTVEGKLVTANPAMARIYGYESPEQLLAEVSNVAERIYVDPERRAELRRLLQRCDAISGFEVEARRRDESRIWVSMAVRAVRDAGGELTCYEGTVEDITPRKRAEQALEEIREAERRRIARDLHDVVLQDLTYALQSMQFTRAMSGASQSDRQEQEIEALQRAVGGVRDAIYDLHLESAEQRSFVCSLESLVELNRRMVPKRVIELVVEGELPPAFARTIGVEVLRIIQEALANVRRHSDARHASVFVEIEEGALLVEVRDDGRGFDPETSAGTGLSGMRERSLALGAHLEVESKPGSGTRIKLQLALPSLPNSSRGTSAVREARPWD